MNMLNPALPISPVPLGRQAMQQHRLLVLLVALHFGAALLVQSLFPARLSLLESWLGNLLTGLIFVLCGYTIFVMLVRRPKRLLHYLGTSMAALLTRQRLLFALPVLALVPLFATSFTALKAAIPLLHPFAWDIPLARLDAQLHGGVHPWVWLQPLLGYPLVTAFLNLVYHLWFFLLIGSVFWLAFCMERARLRMHYLLTFVITWIVLGNVAALWLSSAGPCYFGRITGAPDPYAPLMQYLYAASETVPLWALNVQEILWDAHVGQASGAGLGISAMPSLHVASAVQLALLGWRISPRIGSALSVFAALIMLGSVHLGWHYAVDGYLGALAGWIIWLLVARLPALKAIPAQGAA